MHWLYSILKESDAIQMSNLRWTCDDGRLFAKLTDDDFVECLPTSIVTPRWWSNCTDLESPSNDSESTREYRLITLHVSIGRNYL